MAYQISYGQDACVKKNKREWKRPKLSRETVLRVGLLVTIFALILACMFPQVRIAIRDVVLPGDPEVTATALERLVEAVSDGEAIQTALTEFCREIMDHGLQAA